MSPRLNKQTNKITTYIISCLGSHACSPASETEAGDSQVQGQHSLLVRPRVNIINRRFCSLQEFFPVFWVYKSRKSLQSTKMFGLYLCTRHWSVSDSHLLSTQWTLICARRCPGQQLEESTSVNNSVEWGQPWQAWELKRDVMGRTGESDPGHITEAAPASDLGVMNLPASKRWG